MSATRPEAETSSAGLEGVCQSLAQLGTATVHEASGGLGLLDGAWLQILPGTRACGPARIAHCAQDDNRGAHEVMQYVRPGEVLVLTMPEPTPVALLGELLAVQAQFRGAAAVLVDAAIRDIEQLREVGLPIWSRFVRVRGTAKRRTLGIDVPVVVAGAPIQPGDPIVLDSDGVVVVSAARAAEVAELSMARAEKEAGDRLRFGSGETSWEAYGYDETH